MRRSFPFYEQTDSMDCGPCCLRMVANYYGGELSRDYFRDIMFTEKQGISLLAISDAAEQIGMHTLAVKVTYERLIEDLPLPCIAHWQQEHFIVVIKANKNFVWIADPASGKIKLTKEEFLRNWTGDLENSRGTGILLLLETTPDFYNRGKDKLSKEGFQYLLSYFRNYKSLLWQLVIGVILGSLLQLIFPFLVVALVDTGINNQDVNFIALILGAQAILIIFRSIIEFFRSSILLQLGTRVTINLISDFIIKLVKLPTRFFDTKLTGDLMKRIYDHERLEHFLTSSSLLTFFSVFKFIVFGIILFLWNKLIFTVFLSGTFLYLGWVLLLLKRRKRIDYILFERSADSHRALVQLINGMQEIKLHNAEKYKRWGWERLQASMSKAGLKHLRHDQAQRMGATLINESKNILITFFAAKAVVEGQMTMGMLLAIQYIIGQLNSPVVEWIDFFRSGQDAKLSLERMNEIHLNKDEENIEEKITILPELGSIKLENVYFQYSGPRSRMVLKNISFQVPKGKTTAIVGTSGSGKTTLVKLMLNMYNPTDGVIRVGDTNLANIQKRMWQSKCGAVMQNEYIFHDSIANNIALGDENIDIKRLLHAVQVTNIQSFIESLPLGYNTKIGMDGVGLSQGQKQRLLLARVVYKNPDYIFFDEATNALDAYNETVIMDNLGEFFQRKTVIVVAHRLNTVKNADHIIVLDEGEIVEQGTHEELTISRGAYFQLVRNQLELGA
ncbi:MAG: peptidase domain-containing ABC transporter [Bacteroidetes bacterium]|nr:peptidase domain-containing ABC transporter [Bacteroidota bacterium]